jgi:aspartate oxidase
LSGHDKNKIWVTAVIIIFLAAKIMFLNLISNYEQTMDGLKILKKSGAACARTAAAKTVLAGGGGKRKQEGSSANANL